MRVRPLLSALFLLSFGLGNGFAWAENASEEKPCPSLFDALKEKLGITQGGQSASPKVSGFAPGLVEGMTFHSGERNQLSIQLRLAGANHGLPPHTTKPVVGSTFPYPEFLGETWSLNGEKYRLINAGSRALKRDVGAIEKAVSEGMAAAPGRDLIVPMDPDWVRGKSILNSWQAMSTQKVTDVYRERKPYLRAEDLFGLRFEDATHQHNNDYLILFRDAQRSALKMSRDDFEKNALAAVRLARLTDADPAFPASFYGGTNRGFDSLPHSFRVEGPQRDEILNALQKLQHRHGKRIAEISRFVKFHELPEQVLNGFLKNLFELAKTPTDPIDVLVISVDKFTRRLFGSKYRFKDLVQIHTDNTEMPEYLMYLDTHHPDFEKTLKDLTDKSSDLVRTPVTDYPKKDRWVAPWSMKAEYFEGSPLPVASPKK